MVLTGSGIPMVVGKTNPWTGLHLSRFVTLSLEFIFIEV